MTSLESWATPDVALVAAVADTVVTLVAVCCTIPDVEVRLVPANILSSVISSSTPVRSPALPSAGRVLANPPCLGIELLVNGVSCGDGLSSGTEGVWEDPEPAFCILSLMFGSLLGSRA
jgi:hypothetical protein